MGNIHPLYRWTLFLIISEIILFGGLVYGWPPLVYILKAQGYFADLCQTNETAHGMMNASFVCDAQDANFNLIYTIVVTAAFTCILPAGVALDKLGTRFIRIFSHFLIVVGLLLVVISDPSTTPYLLFPGFTAFAVGGISFYISAMQVGNLFGRHRSTVMTVISGACDGSSIMALIVKFAYDNGISLGTSFTVLMILSVFLFINTFYLLPMGSIPWPLPPNYGLRDKSRKHHIVKPSLSISEHIVSEDKEIQSEQDHHAITKYQYEDFPNIRACVLSPCFLLLCGWFSALQLQINFHLGAYNPFITQLTNGKDELVEHYSEVFAYFLFTSMFFAPLIGLILDRNKGKSNRQPYDDLRDSALGFALTTMLAILFAICNLIPVHQMQYVAFFFYVVAATFLYACAFAVIAIIFPHRYYGTLSGIASLLVGLTQPLAYLLFRITQTYLNNNYRVINIVLMVLSISTLALPIFVLSYARRKNRERQKNHSVESTRNEIS